MLTHSNVDRNYAGVAMQVLSVYGKHARLSDTGSRRFRKKGFMPIFAGIYLLLTVIVPSLHRGGILFSHVHEGDCACQCHGNACHCHECLEEKPCASHVYLDKAERGGSLPELSPCLICMFSHSVYGIETVFMILSADPISSQDCFQPKTSPHNLIFLLSESTRAPPTIDA